MLWNAQRMDRNSFWGLTLILGGAAGNVFDRAVYGRVTDFLDFYISDYHWHTFNVADSAIVIGSGLLLIDSTTAETAGGKCTLKSWVSHGCTPMACWSRSRF